MQRICGPFVFRIYSLCLSWDFCQPACSSLQLDLHWNSPKLPCGMQRICGTFVLKTNHYASRDSLSCYTNSLFKFIFLYLWYIPPHSCALHSFCCTPIFSYVKDYHAKYFSYPWWCSWSAKARNLIFIFNFSSQRPQLNYILLSKNYSFDTMEFSLKNKC